MSWIKYSKDAQKHEAARKVKRELTIMAEKHANIDCNFYITLSGREKADLFTLRMYEQWAYEKLNKDITDSLRQNNEPGGYDGFYTTRHGQIIDYIKDLQKSRITYSTIIAFTKYIRMDPYKNSNQSKMHNLSYI